MSFRKAAESVITAYRLTGLKDGFSLGSVKALHDVLESTAGGSDAKSTAKFDVERTITGAMEHIAHQEAEIAKLEVELRSIRAEMNDLQNEKLEFRRDKAYLKAHIDRLNDDNRKLKEIQIALMRERRRHQTVRSPLHE